MLDITAMDFALNLIITAFVYLLFPIIIGLRGKKYPLPKIKKIVIVNGIVCFLLFTVIQAEFGDGSASAGACVLWSFVAYSILKNRCQIHATSVTASSTAQSATQAETPEPKHSRSDADERAEKHPHGSYNVYGSDIGLAPDENIPNVHIVKENVTHPPQNDSTPHQEHICSAKHGRFRLVWVLLIASVALNVYVYSNQAAKDQTISSLKAEIEGLEKENRQYLNYLNDCSDKVYFIDECVVFIENDGTDLYHKYECRHFVGNDFWVHNTEYAEYLGYAPCPKCYE